MPHEIDLFLKKIKNEKPLLVKYDKIVRQKIENEKKFNDFTIVSSNDSKKTTDSLIPPDISVCNDCILEMKDEKKRYNNYPFISCPNCGPKFSLLKKLPYDRINTTMDVFSMCKNCKSDYEDPYNKRFHYELVSCSSCGPRYSVLDNNGNAVNIKDPLLLIVDLLREGNIIALKGLGGFHLVSSAVNSKPIETIRLKKNRKNKPFAVMSKDFTSIKKFAILSSLEKKIMSCPIKPIVILNKNDEFCLSPLISPGLHNVGVMLPYGGIHDRMFEYVDEPALLMTSANFTNSPIISHNDEAIKLLGSYVNYFFIHDREIFSKCDDSVIKVVDKGHSLLRRARGYVPSFIKTKKSINECILALGGQDNVTMSILYENRCYISQHIGNMENPDAFVYFKEVLKKTLNLLNLIHKYVVCDLNSSYTNSKLCYELTKDESNILRVQHHKSHIASLMMESGVDRLIGIVCDGTGLGLDGNMWGGEIFLCEDTDIIQRIGHLKEQPLIGGDLAANNPFRILLGTLYNQVENFEEFIHSHIFCFPYGEKEIDHIISQVESEKFLKTTSTGRILDAISSLLGICYQRTYEGEPAISLESAAINGNDISIFPKIDNNILDTTDLLRYLYYNRNKYSVKDLAYSSQICIANGLADIAIDNAIKYGTKNIGFSGGVAYNNIITTTMRKKITDTGLNFLTHRQIPPGDGGLSAGQAYLALNELVKI